LGWDSLTIIKGGGGEFERHPSKEIAAFGLRNGAGWEATYPAIFDETRRLSEGTGRSRIGQAPSAFEAEFIDGTALMALARLAPLTAAIRPPERRPPMKAFPMFIRTSGRRVVIVGGGEQAAQKARLLLKTDAELVIVAPALDEELSALVESGRARQITELSAVLFEDAAMAFIGTGCPALDATAHALAKSVRCPVRFVDQPDLCDITKPAIVDRNPIVVAIGSEGAAPVPPPRFMFWCLRPVGLPTNGCIRGCRQIAALISVSTYPNPANDTLSRRSLPWPMSCMKTASPAARSYSSRGLKMEFSSNPMVWRISKPANARGDVRAFT